MASPYDPWVERIRRELAEDFPTSEQEKTLKSILAPVLGLFQRLEEADLVSETQEYPIRRGTACACRVVRHGSWIVAHCLLPIEHNQASIQVGRAGADKELLAPRRDAKYPPPTSEADGLKTHHMLLDLIASLVSNSESS